MILAWVISLLLLCAAFVGHLEQLTALRIIELKTIELAQQSFITAEKSVLKCEKNLSNLSQVNSTDCFIQPIAKNIWLITSKEKPVIQAHVSLDEKSGVTTRLNWRQAFE
jgi:hypothetical protein